MMKRVYGVLSLLILLGLTAFAAAETLTISLIGDCAVGGIDTNNYITSSFTRLIDKLGFGKEYPFLHFAQLLNEDDLTIANCEVCYTLRKPASKDKLNLRAAPEWAEAFKLGGVDAVNTANNHTMDYGRAGYQDTMEALRTQGIGAFGNGELYITQVKGVTIGMTGYTYPHRNDITRQTKDIHELRARGCDLVIVSMHWGREENATPTREQRLLGPKLIEAGADIVFGHGPHVLHPIEIYQGKVIFYSLANLVFGAHSNPKDPDTAVAQLVYSINGELRLNEVRVIPARMHENKNFQPFPYTREEDKQRVYRKMVFKNRDESGLPEDFIFTGSAVFNNP